MQGGIYPPLRDESAAFVRSLPFEGYAIGGLAVGEKREVRDEIVAFTAAKLPADKPRYLMGVGTPIDLLECVRRGVDMFDCIIPTKMAQQGYAYTFDGQIRVTRTEFRLSDEPIDATCDCAVCRRYPRGYVNHLMKGKHALGARMLSIHNVRHYQVLMARMREAIASQTFDALYRELKVALG